MQSPTSMMRQITTALAFSLFLWTARTEAVTPVTVADNEEIRIAAWNLLFFYDHRTSDNQSQLALDKSAPSAAAWKSRVKAMAAAINEFKPTILAVSEIENERVLKDLAQALRDNHNLRYRVVFIQGKDLATEEDVGFLIESRPGDVEKTRVEGTGLTFTNTNSYKIPSKHTAFRIVTNAPSGQRSMTVIAAHLKAGGSTTDEAQRIRQGRVLNEWATSLMQNGDAVIILGDMNAQDRFHTVSATTAMGVLSGLDSPQDHTDDLFDLNSAITTQAERITHVSNRELDRIFLSPNLLDDHGLVFQSIQVRRDLSIKGSIDHLGQNDTVYDVPAAERDLSDHYPIIATFKYKTN